MTQRVNYLRIALTESIRVDDAEPLLAAIRQLKGVLKVEYDDEGASGEAWAAAEQVRSELRAKLYGFIGDL